MKTPAKEYRENQILTAPKEELLLMLLEGAARFAEQGRAFLQHEKFEEGLKSFIRAQRIMLELISSLDENVLDKQLYSNLVSLYYFVYWRFVSASVRHEVKSADEGLKVLGTLRETWSMAVEKSRKEPTSAPKVSSGIDLSS